MSEAYPQPPVWVGHVLLETDRLQESAHSMGTIGMRPIHPGRDLALFELRGRTHLGLIAKSELAPGDAPFDLMIEDLRATHQRFVSLGARTKIEAMSPIDQELFRLREQAGDVTTFNSNLSRASQRESLMAPAIVTGTLVYFFMLNAATEAAQRACRRITRPLHAAH